MTRYGPPPTKEMTLIRANEILSRGYCVTDHQNNIGILKVMQYKSLKTKKDPETGRRSTPISLCKPSQVANVAKRLYDQANTLIHGESNTLGDLEICTREYFAQLRDMFNLDSDTSVSMEELEEILLYH